MLLHSNNSVRYFLATIGTCEESSLGTTFRFTFSVECGSRKMNKIDLIIVVCCVKCLLLLIGTNDQLARHVTRKWFYSSDIWTIFVCKQKKFLKIYFNVCMSHTDKMYPVLFYFYWPSLYFKQISLDWTVISLYLSVSCQR